MDKVKLVNSELVLNDRGRVYHLDLAPGEIGDTVFLFGDPERVKAMSSLFTSVEITRNNREFTTHTGYYRDQKVSALSTGIGTDNIDIVINELDALCNIDLATREEKANKSTLKLVRVGTSGALHEEIQPGSVILTRVAGGLDNVLYYYKDRELAFERDLMEAFSIATNWASENSKPYFVKSAKSLVEIYTPVADYNGITLSSPGFYGPQGRSLRLEISDPGFISKISKFRYEGLKITNFEMEASALLGLAKLLGHEAITICLALANRQTGRFLTEYKTQMADLLEKILQHATSN